VQNATTQLAATVTAKEESCSIYLHAPSANADVGNGLLCNAAEAASTNITLRITFSTMGLDTKASYPVCS
jgi:hypothetical protein